MNIKALIFSLILVCLFLITPCCALQADELLLIVNSRVSESRQLAQYYQAKRHVPADQLLEISISESEDCSRAEYLSAVVRPVRDYLKRNQGKTIRAIVLFYGLPLRIQAAEMNSLKTSQLDALNREQEHYQLQLDQQSLTQEQIRAHKTALAEVIKKIVQIKGETSAAALDAEIALVKVEHYPLEHWVENPFFVGFSKRPQPLVPGKDQVLMVSRLDGPNAETVRRMIDDSLAAEKTGLKGSAYFDARWPLAQEQQLKSYALYDASLHRAAHLTRKISPLAVTIDEQERLLQPGEAPDAALYCGWYSLGRYIDAFDWNRGAVAWHIASSECATLKTPGSRVWCKALLEDGVAATLGPVAEPYVQGFPLPELFFGFLLDGYYTLAESYILSLPYLSWQMILLGDPLYRPFRYAGG